MDTNKKIPQIIVDTSRKDTLRIEIKVSPSNKVVTSAVLLIGFLFLFLPLTLLFIEELEIGFGYIITLVLSWVCSGYFIRKSLWSCRGKEVYDIQKSRISYYYDYGFFRDNLTEKSYNSLILGCHKLSDNETHLISDYIKEENPNFRCYLTLIVDSETIISNISVDFDSLLGLPSLVAKIHE